MEKSAGRSIVGESIGGIVQATAMHGGNQRDDRGTHRQLGIVGMRTDHHGRRCHVSLSVSRQDCRGPWPHGPAFSLRESGNPLTLCEALGHLLFAGTPPSYGLWFSG
jgi:hypothetical protein